MMQTASGGPDVVYGNLVGEHCAIAPKMSLAEALSL